MTPACRRAGLAIAVLATASVASCTDVCFGDDHGAEMFAVFSDSSLAKTIYVGDTAIVVATYHGEYNHGCPIPTVKSTNLPERFQVQSSAQVVAIDSLRVVGTSPGTTTLTVKYLPSNHAASLQLTVNERP